MNTYKLLTGSQDFGTTETVGTSTTSFVNGLAQYLQTPPWFPQKSPKVVAHPPGSNLMLRSEVEGLWEMAGSGCCQFYPLYAAALLSFFKESGLRLSNHCWQCTTLTTATSVCVFVHPQQLGQLYLSKIRLSFSLPVLQHY